MAIHRFLADYATRLMKVPAGSGLSAPFTRDRETIDPDGEELDPDEPRFDGPVQVAAVPPAFEKVYVPGGYLLASGVDHDGVTPLMVYLNVDNGKLLVFHGTAITPQSPNYLTFPSGQVHELTFAIRAAGDQSHPAGNGRTFWDLFFNNTNPVLGDKALHPKTAVVFHGAILLGGPAWKCVDGATDKFELLGWGFALNQNHGDPNSWSLVWDNTGDQLPQLYIPRGREWCMRAAPIYQRGVSYPTACAIGCSNYVYKEQPGGQAASGLAMYFRMTREPLPTASNWVVGANTGAGGKVKVFDIRPASPQFAYRKIHHTHSCVPTEWTPPSGGDDTDGVQMVVSIGDGQERNRFIRFTIADVLANYTATPDPWTIQENYHGVADPEGQTGQATESMQPGCCFFGPEANTILWTTDLEAEWLSLMRLPNGDATVDQARFEHLYGFRTGFGHDAGAVPPPWSRPVFQGLSQARPEVIGHPLAAVYDEEASGAGSQVDARRVLFCPDSSKPKEWVQIIATHNDGSSPTVAVHAGFVYFATFATGIRRTPIPADFTDTTPPTLKSVRPMLVTCGGRNLLHPSFWIDPKDATTFDALLKQAGPNPWQDNGRVLPNPPTMAALAIRIRTRLANASSWAGQTRVSSSAGGSEWHNLASGSTWTPGNQVRRLRGYVLDSSFDRAGLTPSLLPNKTNSIGVRIWDETPPLQGANQNLFSCDKSWSPCTIIAARSIAGGLGLGLRINGHGSGADGETDENYGFFVPDLAMDGNGAIGYPMPADVQGSDEHLTIQGLSLGTDHSWSLRLALMMPIGNWDHYAARRTVIPPIVSDRVWPLLTLWQSDTRSVEFLADCENKKFLVRVRDGSTTPAPYPFGDGKQIWLPDSPLLLAIARSATTGKVYIGASLAGELVHVVPNGIDLSAGSPFTELRFRGAIGGYGPGADGEVCEMRVLGGEIDTAAGMDNSTLLQAFSTLSFLIGP